MIFTAEQAGRVREGRQTAVLTKQTEHLAAGMVRRFRRRTENGVRDVIVGLGDGETMQLLLTVREVEDLKLDQLTVDHARACGLKTVGGLHAEWIARLPRITAVRFVRFELGDTRDTPRFLRSGAPGPLICPHCKRGLADRQAVCRCGSRRPHGRPDDRGYTIRRHLAMLDAGEALSQADTDHYALMNAQRFIARTVEREHRLATRTLAQRLEDLLALGDAVDLRSELRIIEQRIERAERRRDEAEPSI